MSNNKFTIKEIISLIFYDSETNEPLWRIDPSNMLDLNISQESNEQK